MKAEPSSESDPVAGECRVKAWDGATRFFHWSLVSLIVCAYVTRNYLGDPTLYWHRVNGYAILILLIFRLIWGLIGSTTSRFVTFIPTPAATLRYASSLLRRAPMHYLGHNPLGSLLIFALLLAVAAQAGTGLLTSDDAFAQGPLYDHASATATRIAASYHARGFWLILGLASLHIIANLTYQFCFKHRLVTAMITGSKPEAAFVDQREVRFAPASHAVASLALAAMLVACGVLLAGDSLLH
jgi:cytochrome b